MEERPKKDVAIKVRLTSDQLKALEKEAATKAVSVSTIVRWKIDPPKDSKPGKK